MRPPTVTTPWPWGWWSSTAPSCSPRTSSSTWPTASSTRGSAMSSVAAGLALEEGTSLWQDAWRRMRANRLAVVAAAWTLLFVLLCLAGPLLSPWAFDATDLEYGSRGPSLAHWFGTDALGRDLLVRCLLGGRMSLAIGLAAAVVSALVGTVYGAVSGYAGGRTDDLMMRSV